MYKFFSFVLLCAVLSPQNANSQKDIASLINAEKSFAALAAQTNTKDAFLHYLDSADGVVFEDGKINSAYATWHNATANANKLSWQPAFAAISHSGDLGFTTGPWEFRRAAGGNSIAAGSFATIWHVTDKGEWRFLVDIGTDVGTTGYMVDSVKKWVGPGTDIVDPRDGLTLDRIFIQQYAAKQNDAFKDVITNNTWFNLPGQGPITGLQNVTGALAQIPAGLAFMPVGGGVANSGELAYVYGTVMHAGKIQNYLRVWHKANGKYTILLQVLQY